MPESDVEEFYETEDSSDNEENHSRLLSSVSQLDSTQRVKPAQRKEVASEVSEYNLSRGVSSREDAVDVQELVRALGKKAEQGLISKKFRNFTEKSKTLPKPLEKPTEERLKRSIGFENVKKQLQRWDAIVTRNAVSDRLCFPLNGNSMNMQKSSEFLSQFKTKTPLEEEIAKVLKEDNKKGYEEEGEEMDNEFPLTLEEMLEKRKEMAQLRAKLSYKQAKAQRQSKIKSKKYHRLLKRDKIKQQLKEFEILQKTDPEAALKKLSELDKTRAQERASLRHRNTGQWARNLKVRAKYDVETRKILAEQLKVSRDLTQKVAQGDNSDSEEAEEPPERPFPVQSPPSTQPSQNPWTLDVSKEVQDFVSGYRKFWSEENQKAAKEKSSGDTTQVSGKDDDDDDKEVSAETKEVPGSEEGKEEAQSEAVPPPRAKKVNIGPKSPKTSVSIYPGSGVWLVTPVAEAAASRVGKTNRRKGEDIDSLFQELNEKLMQKAEKKAKKIRRSLKERKEKKRTKGTNAAEVEFDLTLKQTKAVERADMDAGLLEGGVEDALEGAGRLNGEGSQAAPAAAPAIDPDKFIEAKPKRLRTCLPQSGSGDEYMLDDEKEQQKMMEEAFGDDDVVAEFNEMKRQEEKEKVEVQTSLPGWGCWGGSGIVPKLKKKRLMVLKGPRRKDTHKKDVILNEKENPNVRNHLVKEVPHPFNSVEAFEASIRAPIGRDWVPETAHQRLIQKAVVTKLGAVIEPMSENEIVQLKKASKCPYRGRKAKENK